LGIRHPRNKSLRKKDPRVMKIRLRNEDFSREEFLLEPLNLCGKTILNAGKEQEKRLESLRRWQIFEWIEGEYFC